MVWRIFHFDQRFEMEGYVRQGGLDYVRMFVTATTKDKSNESTGFLSQLIELEHYYPEQRDAYEGRFWRLCRLTATQENWLRGYLLDADQQPLGLAKLAARLHLSVPVMKQTLAALKRVGLLECVECPAFERPVQEPSQDGAQDDRRDGKGKRQKPQRRALKPSAKAISKRFGKFKNVSENSKSIQESENNRNRNTNLNKDPRTSSSDPTNPTEGEAVTQREDNAQGQATAQGPSGIRTALAPTTTPPICPTSSDPGGPRVIPIHPPPPRPVHADDPTHISHAVAGIRRRCNPASRQAAERVYQALGGPKIDGTRQYAQDMGCLGAAFDRVVQSGLAPPVAADLWEGLIAEAQRLRRIYAKNGGYGAAKRVWFKPILRDKLASRLPPIRDGPATSIG